MLLVRKKEFNAKNMFFFLLVLFMLCLNGKIYANDSEIKKLAESAKKIELKDNMTTDQKIKQFLLDGFYYCAFSKDNLSCEQRSYILVGVFVGNVSEQNANAFFAKNAGKVCFIVCKKPVEYPEISLRILESK